MSEQNRIHVLVVDDHAIVRKGIKALLLAAPDLELVGEAASCLEAIRLCDDMHPNVVLMDMVMPGLDGINTIRLIRQNHGNIQIIALTNFDEEELVRGALEAGASGYLLKNISADELARAIRVASTGKSIIAPEATHILLHANNHSALGQDLTQREREVLTLMSKGLTNVQIGEQLQVSPLTIKNHVARILSKLKSATRTQAVSTALEHKIVSFE